jgi:hypothetical protein
VVDRVEHPEEDEEADNLSLREREVNIGEEGEEQINDERTGIAHLASVLYDS